jgi:hypothetical protein
MFSRHMTRRWWALRANGYTVLEAFSEQYSHIIRREDGRFTDIKAHPL